MAEILALALVYLAVRSLRRAFRIRRAQQIEAARPRNLGYLTAGDRAWIRSQKELN